jgi:FixJ family two-component response regulator
MNDPALSVAAADVPVNARRPLILIDDDDSARRSLQLLLSAHGFEVRSFASAAPILGDPRAIETPLLVIDDQLPDARGLHILTELRRNGWQGRAVLITALPSPGLAEEARKCGFQALVEKPIREGELMAALGERSSNYVW